MRFTLRAHRVSVGVSCNYWLLSIGRAARLLCRRRRRRCRVCFIIMLCERMKEKGKKEQVGASTYNIMTFVLLVSRACSHTTHTHKQVIGARKQQKLDLFQPLFALCFVRSFVRFLSATFFFVN